jgi:beta-N-acetylhexosaminidase
MRALAGTPAERATAALAAGIDVVLHCNGDLAEMEAIAAVTPRLGEAALRRFARGEEMRRATGTEGFDRLAAVARVDALLAGAVA